MNKPTVPKREPRIAETVAIEIVRLDLYGLSKSEIARRCSVHRLTVSRVLARMQAFSTAALAPDLQDERARSLAMYREILREAWQGVEDARQAGKSVAALLAEIRLTQSRIDSLLGVSAETNESTPVAEFRAAVLDAVRVEAPELAPAIARRLLLTAATATNRDSSLDD